jgi:CheY-like chemotaxis protein
MNQEKANKVLIIDDDNRNIFALTAYLKAKGFDCLTSSTAEEGIKIATENKRIAIILIDMMMPEMDGYQALQTLRKIERLATLPVISVTAQAMKGDREKCLEAGATDYISKPVDADLLLNMLTKYLQN